MPDQNPPIDFGYLVEGIIELDPITGHPTIRTVDGAGKPIDFDVAAHVARYAGQEVRFILTPFDTINRLNDMAEKGELGDVAPIPNQGPGGEA